MSQISACHISSLCQKFMLFINDFHRFTNKYDISTFVELNRCNIISCLLSGTFDKNALPTVSHFSALWTNCKLVAERHVLYTQHWYVPYPNQHAPCRSKNIAMPNGYLLFCEANSSLTRMLEWEKSYINACNTIP